MFQTFKSFFSITQSPLVSSHIIKIYNNAVIAAHIDIADILLSHGADLELRNAIQQLPVHVAAEAGQVPSLQYLVNKCSIAPAVRCQNGSTALHLAAKVRPHTQLYTV